MKVIQIDLLAEVRRNSGLGVVAMWRSLRGRKDNEFANSIVFGSIVEAPESFSYCNPTLIFENLFRWNPKKKTKGVLL